MGIPSYFSQLIRNYQGILKIIPEVNAAIDNLYLDSNSIIYDCVRNIEYDDNNERFEIKLIRSVCEKLEEYIENINPKNVLIAFDGVAPVAKLEQQRTRRYRSWLEKQIINDMDGLSESEWCTAAITPGTKFMSDLADGVNLFFKNNKTRNIIVSSSKEPGEGEHKIFDYIRKNSAAHKDVTTVIYGLDADLIMLTLNHLHISKKLLLFRETPHFIRQISKELDPERLYCLDIPSLSSAINTELVGELDGNQYDVRRVHDYILLCFLLGNDFMPHFPALNIRTIGLEYIMAAYRSTIGAERNAYITDGNDILWKNLRKIVGWLADQEDSFFKEEYQIRKKWQRRALNPQSKTSDTNSSALQSLPVVNREQELSLALDSQDSYKRDRYYKTLFHCDCDEERVKFICVKYLEALEWTYTYYREGCKDWRWCYPYHYAPLLTDLIKYIPHFKTCMLEKTSSGPIKPLTQLCYVLPEPYHYLLPRSAQTVLTNKYSQCFRTDWELQWAFCRYFWECHVDMEPIDIDKLESDIRQITQS
jgi:5'-3' exonuclease